MTPIASKRVLRKFYSVRLVFALVLFFSTVASAQDATRDYSDLDAPEHLYWEKELNDPFTKFLEEIKQGKHELDYSSELAYLKSMMKALGISRHSQLMLFSVTSLQTGLITPRNPRAIYFNESIYLGYIPGGRLEVISLDPELGGIFYIFDIPTSNRPPIAERSDRCMNCHAKPSVGNVPGIVLKSVLPGPNGGSVNAYRRDQIGHHIAYEERFGGWHVTGEHGINKHWGNKLGRLFQGEISTTDNLIGQNFDISRYAAEGSDILAHLLIEHQAGFVNRVIETSYRARTYWTDGGNRLKPEHRDELKSRATELVRYILFADEPELPGNGAKGDPLLKSDFLAAAIPDKQNRSLREFDLRKRLFRYRCSYMIYTPVFRGLPDWFRKEVYSQLKDALRPNTELSREFAYLPTAEKRAIAEILIDTIDDPAFR